MHGNRIGRRRRRRKRKIECMHGCQQHQARCMSTNFRSVCESEPSSTFSSGRAVQYAAVLTHSRPDDQEEREKEVARCNNTRHVGENAPSCSVCKPALFHLIGERCSTRCEGFGPSYLSGGCERRALFLLPRQGARREKEKCAYYLPTKGSVPQHQARSSTFLHFSVCDAALFHTYRGGLSRTLK